MHVADVIHAINDDDDDDDDDDDNDDDLRKLYTVWNTNG